MSKPLHVVILSRDKKLYSTRRLIEATTEAGHKVTVIDPLQCYMNITSNKPTVHVRGKEIKGVDAVIPRIGASNTIYATAVLRQFEAQGVFTPNGSIAIVRSRDKLRVHQMLAKNGIPMPRTSYAHATDCTKEIINMVGGAPVIIKLTEGTQGKGVVKVDTLHGAEAVINAFRHLDANILIQEFIEEAASTDLRCFVVGDKVVASMMRTAADGEFRANIHRGGTAQAVKLTPQERQMATRVARLVGLEIAGVDLIRSSQGPLVLEINSSPGLEGIEKASKQNVAKMIVDHVAKRIAKPGKRKEL